MKWLINGELTLWNVSFHAYLNSMGSEEKQHFINVKSIYKLFFCFKSGIRKLIGNDISIDHENVKLISVKLA